MMLYVKQRDRGYVHGGLVVAVLRLTYTANIHPIIYNTPMPMRPECHAMPCYTTHHPPKCCYIYLTYTPQASQEPPLPPHSLPIGTLCLFTLTILRLGLAVLSL
jgi:hypothetical protein